MSGRVGLLEIGAAALLIGELVPAEWCAGVAACAIVAVAVALAGTPRARGMVVAAGLFSAFAVGALLAASAGHTSHGSSTVRSLTLPWRGEIDGIVRDGPWVRGERGRLVVDVTATRRGRGWVARRGRVQLTAAADALGFEAGARIITRVALRTPRNFRNPGGFDWVAYVARRGVHAVGTIPAGMPIRFADADASTHSIVARWRQRVDAVLGRLEPSNERAVLRALVIGRREEISERLRRSFTRAGLAHVLAISGMHIGVIAWCTTMLIDRAVIRVGGGSGAERIRTWARLLACFPAALYGALGGAGPSVMRAWVALGVVAIAFATDRRPAPLRVVAVVAVVLGVSQPGIVRDVGFQLSLAAVTGLVVGMGRRRGVLAKAVGASIGAWAATAPLVILHFQELSIVAPFVGAAVTPLFGTAPVALGVMGALVTPVGAAVAAGVFSIATWALAPGVCLVDALGSLPGVAVLAPRPSALELLLVLALVTFFLLPRGSKRRCLGIVLVLALAGDFAWWLRERWAPGAMRVTFLDVGQGDAAVIELPMGEVVLVDGGGFPGSRFDVGAAVLAPFLASRKVRRVELLVVSHTHPDHYAGLETIVERYRPRELWWPGVGGEGAQWRRFVARARRNGVRIRVVARGVTRTFGDAALRVLHPSPRRPGSVNDASLVLSAEWRGRRVVFTGDIEAAGEALLLREAPLRRVDVVKVAHHGSRTSSTLEIVRRFDPSYAVISAGADNRYGHPEPAVERRWAAEGACVLRTDRCGAVVARLEESRVSVSPKVSDCRCGPRVSG